MRSFTVAVKYFDRTQLPTSTTAACVAKPRPNSGQSAKLIVRSASTKGHQAIGDPSAEHVPLQSVVSTNGSGWSLAPAVVHRSMYDGCVDSADLWLREPSSGPKTSYTALYVPLLRADSLTSSTTSTIDVIDEPEDLSVRTGARHVTDTARSTTPTDSRFQHTQLQGKVFTESVHITDPCVYNSASTNCKNQIYLKRIYSMKCLYNNSCKCVLLISHDSISVFYSIRRRLLYSLTLELCVSDSLFVTYQNNVTARSMAPYRRLKYF